MVQDTTGRLLTKVGRPRWNVNIEINQYTVKTAETEAEIERALRLRHEVFLKEQLNAPLPSGLDTDRFDSLCDHLIVQIRETGQVVATYRLNPSVTDDYYAMQEFEMEAVLSLKGPKLEIGRACVAREHRQSEVFAILWRGLMSYMRQSEVRYVFGCSSVPVLTSHELASLCQYLRVHHFSTDSLRVHPLPSGAVSVGHLESTVSQLADDAVQRLIPPILKYYLHCGCKLCGEPYYDSEFKSYDFFTLLDVTTASPSMLRSLSEAGPVEVKEKTGGV